MSQHPSKDELSGFLLGKLPPQATAAVGEHIDECPPCQNTLSELSSQYDTLLQGLQKGVASEVDSVGREAVKEVAAKAPRLAPAGTAPAAKPKSQPPPDRQAPDTRAAPSQTGGTGNAVLSRDEFRSSLLNSGIYDADDLAELERKYQAVAQAGDGRELARALVQCGALSKYQATAVYQGNLKGLVYGEYAVVDLLGEGGMGQVFKARHRSMDRIVALKVLAKAAVGSPDAVKRFQREVKAAAKLIHPNIVTAFDASKHDGTHYLVMEFVPGSDLSAVVKKHGPLPIAQAVNYTIQAARGLAFAHSKGVVHRDIKPANLLVDGEGLVKILDMGLARLELEGADEGAGHGLTQTGQIMGTVDYMAPEQAFDTSKADAKADVYSLGCTLYRLLTGGNLFGGDTLMQKLLAHREQPAPSLRAVRPEVSAELDAIFGRMVAKEPQDRPTTTELIAELEALDRREATAAFVPTSIAKDSQSGSLFAVNPITTVGKQEPQNTISLVTAAVKSGGRGKKSPIRRLVIGTGAAGAAALCIWGILVQFKDEKGTVIAEAAVPSAVGASVVVTPSIDAPSVAKSLPAAAGTSQMPSGLVASGISANSTASPRWPFDPTDGREYVWSPPENLGSGVNHKGRDAHPRLTADELTLIFSRGDNLFTARRRSRDETFAGCEPLAGGLADFSTEEISMTGDGLEVFVSDMTESIRNVWVAKRRALDQPFGEPVRLESSVNSSKQESSPAISSDGLQLAIYSDRSDPQRPDAASVYLFRRDSRSEPFQPGVYLERKTIPVSARIVPSWLSTDGRVLLTTVMKSPLPWWYFWHVRGSSAERFSKGVTFGEPFMSPIEPGSAWVSPDGMRMYFHSRDISNGHGDLDLWMVRRVPGTAAKPAAPPATTDYALQFDGDAVVRFPGLSFDAQSAYTMEGFVTAPAKARQQSGDGLGGMAFGVFLQTELEFTKDERWRWIYHFSRGDQLAIAGGPSRSGRTHLACVSDGKTRRLFIDGRLYQSVSFSTSDLFRKDFAVGERGFQGIVDEVRVSGVARYTTDFAPPSRFEPDAATLGIYHFDEAAGEVLKDSSGNNRHGNITGARWVRADGLAIDSDGSPTVPTVPTSAAIAATSPAASGKLFLHDPGFPQWVKEVQDMPAERQVEAVRTKLMELNPGFDGKLWGYHKDKPVAINGGSVIELGMHAQFIADVSPVRALSGLKVLTCAPLSARAERFSDLSPLAGMRLNIVNVGHTAVSDLSPLRGMPLANLFVEDTQVSDLTPLVGMPLSKVTLNETLVSDLTPLDGCLSLRELHIKRTKVTPAAIAALQKALPNLRITADALTVPTPTGTK